MKMPSLASAYHCGSGCLSSDSNVGSYFTGVCAAHRPQNTRIKAAILKMSPRLRVIGSPFGSVILAKGNDMHRRSFCQPELIRCCRAGAGLKRNGGSTLEVHPPLSPQEELFRDVLESRNGLTQAIRA